MIRQRILTGGKIMIRIICDTTTSFTLADYEKNGILPIPLYLREGDIAQKELFEISYDEFYRKQRAGGRFTTSQPDPSSFLDIFRPIVEAGDEAICVLISNAVSGTMNSAHLALQMLETDRISLFDSLQSGLNQGNLALKAKQLAEAGRDRAAIIRELEAARSRSRIYVIVDSLRYLYEGGRLSGAQALIGSMIQIKPIIWFDAEGKMTAFDKVRTLKNAKTRINELVREAAATGIESIGLHYGDNRAEAEEYAAELAAIAGMPVPLVRLSPVLAAHTGPEIFGVCFIAKP
jgi:DegV family protein with EDD domain